MRKLTVEELKAVRQDLANMEELKKFEKVYELEGMVDKYDELFFKEAKLDKDVIGENDLYAILNYLAEKYEDKKFEDMAAYNVYAVMAWIAFTKMQEI